MTPELLAPVGGEQSLKAAVYAGADAVYLGASEISARANAQNFSDEQLKKAVLFCHSFGVKVYLAMNTLLTDRQWDRAAALVRLACEVGIDALIVQDIGLAAFVKKSAPNLPIHASTQMSVHTVQGALFLKENGFSRVVLAREMSLNEIAKVCRAGLTTEVFVHGALCFSVSGQCYLSAMLGGRSANRGNCAQPCRLPFSVDGTGSADLSLKDLCAAQSVAALRDAGVGSLKIEGRMKRPEYVAASTAFYRALLDHTDSPISLDELQSVFSRSGFTNGYITGQKNADMFGTRRREDSPSKGLYGKIREIYRRPIGRFPLKAELTLHSGEPAKLTLTDLSNGNVEQVQGQEVQRADRQPVSKEQLRMHLAKLGGTPYVLKEAEIEVSPDAFFPIGQMNRWKKEAVQALLRQRCSAGKITFFQAEQQPEQQRILQPTRAGGRLRMQCRRWEQVVCPERFELIAVETDELLAHLQQAQGILSKLAVAVPRAMFGKEAELEQKLEQLKKAGIRHMLVQNLAQIRMGKGFVLHGGVSLPIANRWAARQLKRWGLRDCILSPECSLRTLQEIQGEIDCGILAAGRMPLMVARNCPVKARKGCSQCKEKAYLTDRLQYNTIDIVYLKTLQMKRHFINFSLFFRLILAIFF